MTNGCPNVSTTAANILLFITLPFSGVVPAGLKDAWPSPKTRYPKPLTASIILTRTACASPYTMLQFSA
jgi:hypothetical protein